jgi:uncharacterized protein (TIGR02996 family)
MNADLARHPQLLALLDAARLNPHDDTSRLVLADWLDEHGEHDRSAFVRLQLRLAPGAVLLEHQERQDLVDRCRQLVARHGGGWLGRLWRWPPWQTSWHRGLLAVRLRGRYEPADLADVLPWLDTALVLVTGLGGLRRAVDLLTKAGVNHLGLDLRNALREDTLLQELARLPASPCLRTLTLGWPMRLLRRSGVDEQGRPRCTPAASTAFLRRLLDVPLGLHLTHLASSWPFDDEQAEAVRGCGVEPAHAPHALWAHDLPASCFRSRR